ncbi:MAG TPA: cytochrome P450 [Acidimicrobiales bacterium]|nr:cytochrome P450 [Acidimicrobiales bacterium]
MTVTDLPNNATPPFEINPLDPRFYDDPWEGYRWLRDQAPVFWDAINDLWVVSRHEDVSHVSRHAELYSAAQGVRPNIAAPMSIISMDDPEHTRQRRIVSKGFTPRKVREITDHIRELSNEIIDEIAQRGEIDFVSEFAIHVPLIVIAEMMGIDPAIRADLYRWSDAMMEGDGHTDPDHPAIHGAAVAFGEYTTLCTELIAERRIEPVDDIIGLLTGAFDAGELESEHDYSTVPGGETLSDDDLLMFLVLLVVAGNETTRNALSGGLAALSEFPEQRDRLIADPSLWDLAVDELIRFVSPVLSFSRTVTETHDYKGHRFEEGQRVLMLYQSANRDERVFDDPDELIVDRSPNPHLAFGIGTHFCMGANLAKAEVRVVLEELFKRLPDIRRVDEGRFDRGNSSLVLSVRELNAVFTPEHTP